jgi:hypothetical protein
MNVKPITSIIDLARAIEEGHTICTFGSSFTAEELKTWSWERLVSLVHLCPYYVKEGKVSLIDV